MKDSTIKLIMREKAPCDDCEQAQKCKEQFMACRVFGMYTRTGRFSIESPRDPSYTLYNKIFSEDEKELIKILKELNRREASDV